MISNFVILYCEIELPGYTIRNGIYPVYRCFRNSNFEVNDCYWPKADTEKYYYYMITAQVFFQAL